MAANTFALDIARFVAKAKNNADTVTRKVGIESLTRVVMRTPVGNPDKWKSPPPPGYAGGRARANWNVSFSVPDTGTSDAIDKAGRRTIAAGTRALSQQVNGRDIYIANSVPYIQALERGWSGQAPNGMVALTVAEFQTFVNNAVRSLPK